MKLLKTNYAILSGTFLIAFEAFSCPSSLQSLHTRYLPQGSSLCSVYDRYQAAVESLKLQGVDSPDRLAEVLGPRFIDRQTWEAKKIESHYDPSHMYEPAPQTWDLWELGKEKIDERSNKNRQSRSFQPIDLEWIRELQSDSLNGVEAPKTPFRSGGEIGMHFYQADALHRAQIEALLATSDSLKTDDLKGPFIRWTPTKCYESQSQITKDYMDKKLYRIGGIDLSYWPAIPKLEYIQDENALVKQCGYLIYLSYKEVPRALAVWIQRTNKSLTEIVSGAYVDDALLELAKIQRLFIAIHPFTDGNGRTSRFVLDLAVQSLGLPPPVFEDMNHDLDITNEIWAYHLGHGILTHVEWAERCSKNLAVEECRVLEKKIGVPNENLVSASSVERNFLGRRIL